MLTSDKNLMEDVGFTDTYNGYNRVLVMLDLLCRESDLNPYLKKQKAKTVWLRGYLCHLSAIARPNHINAITSESENALQVSTYDCEKKGWNWEKLVSCNVKYHVSLENLKAYGYHGFDIGMKVHHLLNGISHNRLLNLITVVHANHDKFERDFNRVVVYLSQYIKNRGPKNFFV